MSASRADARAWLKAQRGAIVITIVHADGSTPRDPGTSMLVGHHLVCGTIGGGHLEETAIRIARDLLLKQGGLGSANALPWEQQWALGPSLGQCCGGVMRLRFSLLDENLLQDWYEAPPRFFVQLYGAGHVGRALVNALLPLPGQVRWIESRSSELDLFLPTLSHHPNRHQVEVVLSDDPVAEVRHAPLSAIHLVMTHSHALDLELVQAIVKLPHAPLCGLIGSKTKKMRFLRDLQRRGLPTTSVICPIGLPGLKGKQPEVIAASVAAQLLMGQWQDESAFRPPFIAEPLSTSG